MEVLEPSIRVVSRVLHHCAIGSHQICIGQLADLIRVHLVLKNSIINEQNIILYDNDFSFGYGYSLLSQHSLISTN
jgi:hypothetical protein